MPVRHHFPRWIICFYFPMETTLGMGPTAVIPGTPYYTTNGQDATGCEVVGNWSDDRLERVLPNPGSHRTEQDLDARDARLNLGITTGLGDEFEEKKLLVPAGTLAVLHFDLFHRGTRRIPDHDQRSMFKLQFFRTSAPTEPTWDHDPAAAEFPTDVGEPEQHAVWKGVWNWMKGAPPEETPSAAASAETAKLVRTLEDKRERERSRVGAAYALGHSAAAGDEAALQALLRTVEQQEAEAPRRASVYGLAAAGDVAVAGLTAALTRAVEAQGSASVGTVVPAVAHALGEASRQASSCELATDALLGTMANIEERLTARMGLFEGVSNGVDQRASKLRFALAASIQALGCVAERVVAAGDADAAATAGRICDALLPYTLMGEEPGSESPHGSIVGDDFWAREGAAVGLLRLAGGGGRGAGLGQVIQHTSPAYHSDERFGPAFGRLALKRASSGAAAIDVDWLTERLGAEEVQAVRTSHFSILHCDVCLVLILILTKPAGGLRLANCSSGILSSSVVVMWLTGCSDVQGWTRMAERAKAFAKDEWLTEDALRGHDLEQDAGVGWHDRTDVTEASEVRAVAEAGPK